MGMTPMSTLHSPQKDIRPSLFETMVEQRLRCRAKTALEQKEQSPLLEQTDKLPPPPPRTVKEPDVCIVDVTTSDESAQRMLENGSADNAAPPAQTRSGSVLSPDVIVRSASSHSLSSAARTRSPTDSHVRKHSVLREHDIM